jgi:hypothetical protein
MYAHLAAIAALAPVGVHVYDTDVERPQYNPADWSGTWTTADKQAWSLPDRYIILTAPSFRERASTLSRVRLDVDDYLQVTAVESTPRGARWLQEAVRVAFDRAKPVLTGFNTDLHFSASGIHAVDRELSPHRYYSVDTYRYKATPA